MSVDFFSQRFEMILSFHFICVSFALALAFDGNVNKQKKSNDEDDELILRSLNIRFGMVLSPWLRSASHKEYQIKQINLSHNVLSNHVN